MLRWRRYKKNTLSNKYLVGTLTQVPARYVQLYVPAKHLHKMYLPCTCNRKYFYDTIAWYRPSTWCSQVPGRYRLASTRQVPVSIRYLAGTFSCCVLDDLEHHVLSWNLNHSLESDTLAAGLAVVSWDRIPKTIYLIATAINHYPILVNYSYFVHYEVNIWIFVQTAKIS